MDQGYSIRMAAQLSGLTPYVIRAWEKRYNVVSPQRTQGNQRSYSDDDVRRLKLLSEAVKSGHKISRIVSLPDEDLGRLSDAGESAAGSSDEVFVRSLIDSCLDAVSGMDPNVLEDRLTRAAIDLGLMEAVDSVIVPFMEEIGEGWHKGRWRISHEHLASSVLRTFLGTQLRSFDVAETSHTALVTTPSGQVHELGCLVSALTAASAGFHVIYLGSSIPAQEIIHSAEETGATLVLVSIVFPGGTTKVRQEMDTLRRYLPEDCRLILGGSSAGPYLLENEAPAPRKMKTFRKRLLEIRRSLTEES